MGGSSPVPGRSSPVRAAIGVSVGGFTLVRQLGAGGMGETWEAVRRIGDEFEQRVAVKLGSPELLRHPEGRELLRREASLAASLRHPNIAAVLDWNEDEGYIVCELVEGADLRTVLRQAPGGRLPAPLLVHVLMQIARGLSHAHRRLLQGQPSPVIHRDMSPGNVVVDYDGCLKIVDFGIAKAVGSPDWSKNVKGKLAYMAPEQATGGPLDGRADQYAVGVIAYEAATGVRPNDGAHDGETLAKILDGDHIPLGRLAPQLPSGLVDIIERMLALHVEHRFPTMDSIIDALEPLTPSLTVHRSLAALVHRAHPPHTIVQEEGKFVSRPVVSFELPTNDPLGLGAPVLAQTPSSVRSLRANPPALPPPNPFGPTEALGPGLTRMPERDSRPSPLPPAPEKRPEGLTGWRAGFMFGTVALLSAMLGGAIFWVARSPSSSSGTGEAKRAADVHTAVAPIVEAAPAPAKAPAAAAEAAKGLPQIAAPAAAAEAAKGVPQIAAPPARAAPPASVVNVSVPPGEKRDEAPLRHPRDSKTTSAEQHGAKPGKGESEPAVPAAGSVLRVKVFPWGRVWVDGRMRGSAPPILSVKVGPGSHVVAVGHEQPIETRTVTVGKGETPLISFDLEGL